MKFIIKLFALGLILTAASVDARRGGSRGGSRSRSSWGSRSRSSWRSSGRSSYRRPEPTPDFGTWWSQTKDAVSGALDTWTARNIRDMQIGSGAHLENSTLAVAFKEGQQSVEGVVNATFEKMQPVMQSLAQNLDQLRKQDLRQAAEVKLTMDENPLKQKIESQVQEVSGILAQSHQQVMRKVGEAQRKLDREYRDEEAKYYDDMAEKLYDMDISGDFRGPSWSRIQDKERELNNKLMRQASEGQRIVNNVMSDLFYSVYYSVRDLDRTIYYGSQDAMRSAGYAAGSLSREFSNKMEEVRRDRSQSP